MGLQTLDRGLEILQLLAEQPRSVDGLSAALGCPRSTTYRALTTLRSRQLVDRTPQARYVLGFGLLHFTRALFGRIPIREAALAILRDVAEDVGERGRYDVRSLPAEVGGYAEVVCA